jgi:hypothetical protein
MSLLFIPLWHWIGEGAIHRTPLTLPSADDRLGWATRFPRGCTPGWYVLPCQGKYKVTLQWARSADFVPAYSAG